MQTVRPSSRDHSLPDRAGASMAEREQIVLAEPAERRAQQGRQIEIIFALQRKAPQCDQVHRRDLLGQGDAVGAGHGNAAQLQLPDDLAAEGFAARQQNHDIARADRRGVSRQGNALCSQSLIWSAILPASQHHRAVRLGRVNRAPMVDLRLLRHRQRGPEFDAALVGLAMRFMLYGGVLRGQAGAGGFAFEHLVDEFQNFRGGPARHNQGLIEELLLRPRRQFHEFDRD